VPRFQNEWLPDPIPNINWIKGGSMSNNQTLEKGKLYATGFVLGLIAAPIIAFSAGWVTTSGARSAAVENARVETLAGVCADTVQRSYASQSMDLATLKGYDNRAARDDVVTKTVANIHVPDSLANKITAGCSKSLA
jgi:hypothetical protein